MNSSTHHPIEASTPTSITTTAYSRELSPLFPNKPRIRFYPPASIHSQNHPFTDQIATCSLRSHSPGCLWSNYLAAAATRQIEGYHARIYPLPARRIMCELLMYRAALGPDSKRERGSSSKTEKSRAPKVRKTTQETYENDPLVNDVVDYSDTEEEDPSSETWHPKYSHLIPRLRRKSGQPIWWRKWTSMYRRTTRSDLPNLYPPNGKRLRISANLVTEAHGQTKL